MPGFRAIGPPTLPWLLRLDCCAMPHFRPFRQLLQALLGLLLAVTLSCAAHTQTPLPIQTGPPGAAPNHRLILKDGTYQIVRKYVIVGDRVRYISVERGGEWEELPVALVDWEATRKWERDKVTAVVEEPSPAMKEAAEIEREEGRGGGVSQRMDQRETGAAKVPGARVGEGGDGVDLGVSDVQHHAMGAAGVAPASDGLSPQRKLGRGKRPSSLRIGQNGN